MVDEPRLVIPHHEEEREMLGAGAASLAETVIDMRNHVVMQTLACKCPNGDGTGAV